MSVSRRTHRPANCWDTVAGLARSVGGSTHSQVMPRPVRLKRVLCLSTGSTMPSLPGLDPPTMSTMSPHQYLYLS
eukprot:1195066-Prorocentrum_minimum.AAC.2